MLEKLPLRKWYHKGIVANKLYISLNCIYTYAVKMVLDLIDVLLLFMMM